MTAGMRVTDLRAWFGNSLRQPGPETASAADECPLFAKRRECIFCHIYFHIAALPPQALPKEDT